MLWIKKNSQILAMFVISVIHLVGIIGLQTEYKTSFEALTFLNLFLTFLIVIAFYQEEKKAVFSFFIHSFVLGMLVEIIGVTTSFPFGAYYYTDILGLKFLDVPLIIGVNWFLLSYGILSILQRYLSNLSIWFKSLVSAIIMTFMDVLIEPFAIHHSLWVWKDETVPLQNYLSWFLISFVLFYVGFRIIPNEKNSLAAFVILVFVIFFSLNNLISSLL